MHEGLQVQKDPCPRGTSGADGLQVVALPTSISKTANSSSPTPTVGGQPRQRGWPCRCRARQVRRARLETEAPGPIDPQARMAPMAARGQCTINDGDVLRAIPMAKNKT